jgi:hypothetical protein
MSDKYLKFSQLRTAGVPHGHAVLTEMIKCGGFPRPKFRRGGEDVWRLSDVVSWLANPCQSYSGDEPWLYPVREQRFLARTQYQ